MDLSILKQNLEAAGYDVAEFDTKEDATAYLNEQIDGQSVAVALGCSGRKNSTTGIGGSNNNGCVHIFGKRSGRIRRNH